MNREEVEAIRDEERFLLKTLDELVNEFTAEFNKLDVMLPDFLRGYWSQRMTEVCSPATAPDAEELERIKSVGVVLQSSGGSERVDNEGDEKEEEPNKEELLFQVERFKSWWLLQYTVS